MTSTANKNGLRAAGMKRTAKASQKTPLPPRQETIAMVEEALREAAAAKGAKGNPITDPRPDDSPSWLKAKAFIAHIKPFGWSTSSGTPQGVETPDHIEVTARRGLEAIHIEWIGGVFQDTATHAIADRVVKLRNASAAKKTAERTPDAAQQELERVSNNKAFRKRPTEESGLKRTPLPFDIVEATDEEVIKALHGCKVSWHNRFREVSEDAVVSGSIGVAGHYSVHMARYTDSDGVEHRILNFVCPQTGFRSLRLSSLLRVSGGKRRPAAAAIVEGKPVPKGKVSLPRNKTRAGL